LTTSNRRLKNLQPAIVNQHTGGLVFGGGGFFIPIRNSSPVSFLFHDARWLNGCSILIAPGQGQ
jgi:hypothetical protein